MPFGLKLAVGSAWGFTNALDGSINQSVLMLGVDAISFIRAFFDVEL
jgi:hypothetical protein